MNEMQRWGGKVALVTGTSSGIGRAVASRLVGAGMKVVGCARRGAELESLRAELAGAPGELSTVRADLRNEQQVLQLFATARERFGGVDVLVNNAGLGHDAPLMSGQTERWRDMLEVNVLALCICTREAVVDMRARGDRGHVVHISSMSAHRVPPGGGVYAATKHAVRALTEGLRQELRAAGSGIRVTAISPGFVETGFAAQYHQSEEAARHTYGRYRCIKPGEVADAVIYALEQPAEVEIHDVLLRPTAQPN